MCLESISKLARSASEAAPGAVVLVSRLHFGLVSLVLCLPAFAHAEGSQDEPFLAGLRQRRLFELAESYCLRRIERSELSQRSRTTLATELARTYAEHAIHSAPAESSRRWQQAHQVVADFQQAYPSSPRLLLVQLQDSLTWLAQGEIARQQTQVLAGADQQRETAKEHLRKAITSLAAVAKQIDLDLRRVGRRREGDESLTSSELEALQRNVDYQLARALRNQAQCYPPASDDRANSLTRALEQLEPLSRLSVVDDLVWKSGIDRAVCYRLLRDSARAAQALAALSEDQPPPMIALRIQAERIHAQLEAGDDEGALKLASAGRTIAGQASPELDYARLEAMVASWRSAKKREEKSRAEALAKQSTELVRLIEKEHGPYWMRRAETLLASHVSSSAGGQIDAMQRAAESFFRGGQLSESLAAYDRAYEEAIRKGQGEQAFQLAFTAATIEHQQKHHEEALKRYRQVGLALRKHPRAGKAHLLAILNAAHLVRSADAAQRSQWTDFYAQLLAEHLATDTWTNQPSASQARLWLGDLLQSRGHWREATVAYQAIASTAGEYEHSVRAAIVCYDRWLSELEAAGEPRQAVAEQAEAHLAKVMKESSTAGENPWNPLTRFCAVASAKLQLHHGERNFSSVESMLTRAIEGSSDAAEDWISEARILLVYALAGQGKREAATKVMDQISGGSIHALVSMFDALAGLAHKARPPVRVELARLALRAAVLLEKRPAEIQGDNQRVYETALARSFAAAGETAKALKTYNVLAKRYPKDGDIHEARARLLMRPDDVPSRKQALSQWQAIEKKSRRGSDRWFRARLAQAETLFLLNQRSKAAKLIKLTEVLHPELGSREMKVRFQRLLAKCQR